jgi:hypothetical protein
MNAPKRTMNVHAAKRNGLVPGSRRRRTTPASQSGNVSGWTIWIWPQTNSAIVTG